MNILKGAIKNGMLFSKILSVTFFGVDIPSTAHVFAAA